MRGHAGGNGNEFNLVSLGDSQTAKFGTISSVFQTYPLLLARQRGYGACTNLAVSGYLSADVVSNLTGALNHRAGAMSLMIGANDVVTGVSVVTYKSNVKSAVQTMQAQRARVTLLSFCPVRTAPALAAAPAYVDALQEIRSETGCEFIDVFAAMTALSSLELDALYQPGDNTHIGATGHAFIASLCTPPAFSQA